MKFKSLAVAFGTWLAFAGAAGAQTFPTKPMTMIIPFAAGGPQDVIGRIIAQRISEILGQQVVVENIGGAGGMTGSRRVADAAPDGYTFVLASVGTHAQNQSLYKKPLYDAATDFTPVALIAETPIALITRKTLPVNNFKEFIAYAKANQAKMQYGSAGAGSATHLGCVVLNYVIGVNITHVPYRGTGPAMQDLVGGRIDYLCDIIATAKPQIDGGSVKGIAIMTKERARRCYPICRPPPSKVHRRAGLYLERDLPAEERPRRRSCRSSMARSSRPMHTPAVKARLSELGALVVPDDRATPQYLGQFVKSEIEKWAVPIKASGVSVD